MTALAPRWSAAAGFCAAFLLLLSGPVALAQNEPTVLVLISEKVMGVFDTTGFEEPGQVASLLQAEFLQRGFRVVDLEAVQRKVGLARARQLLEGDQVAARELALQAEADYVLSGDAVSKPAGTRMFGTNMQSIQANVTVRLVAADGRVLGAASGQAAQAHIDEVQGGVLALGKAAEKVVESLDATLTDLIAPATSVTNELTVQIKGLVSYRHLDFVVGVLQNDLEGIEDARVRSFHGGVAELGLHSSTGSEVVARSVAARQFTGFRLVITHVSRSLIEINAVLDE